MDRQNAGWHDGMFHVTDLLPPLVALAGGSTARTRPLDGHDIFGSLASGGASPRRELLYNINPRPDNLVRCSDSPSPLAIVPPVLPLHS